MMRSSAAAPVPTAWSGGTYSIKRQGATLTNFDVEQVQTPGCIQAHGALLVMRPDDPIVRQASEHSFTLLGSAPEALPGKPMGFVAGEALAAQSRASMASGGGGANLLRVFTLPGRPGIPMLDVSMHNGPRSRRPPTKPAATATRGISP